MKPIQYFTDEYLKTAKTATPTQIAVFLENYRLLHSHAELKIDQGPTKLISIRLPIKMIAKLKALAKTNGRPYQALIKQFIESGLHSSDLKN